MARYFLFGVLALMLLLVGGGYWLWVPDALSVVRPVRGNAVQAIYATGTVEASVTVRIAPQQAGRLAELRVDEGEAVRAGQVLARLDDSDLRASQAGLEATAHYADQQYQRLEALAAKGFVSADQLQQARSTRESAEAGWRHASEQVEFMTLKSSVNGRVIRRDGEVGDFIPVNQPVFYLARARTPPRIDSDVDEEDIAQVKVGQDVLIHADAFPDKTFTGRVTEITPKGDPVARSYRVRVGLPADTPLMIGMTAETNIVIARRTNALLVPSTALDGDHVWIVRNGHAVAQRVDIGAKGAERTEILNGINDSDDVVVQPPSGLRAGHRVRALPLTSPSSGGATSGAGT